MTTPAPSPLVWIDLETTGLDVARDVILEIGLVATDGDLNPWRNLEPLSHVVVPVHGLDITRLDPVVVEMHSKSGLLTELAGPDAVHSGDAEDNMHNWLGIISAATGGKVLMAGSTVGQFDRQFFKRDYPRLDEEFFEYRVLDVSSVKEIVRRWYGERYLFDSGKKLHRVIPDIAASIAELGHFRATVFHTHPQDVGHPPSS